MGASRREHHRQEQAKRDAAAEANRQRAMMEQQQQAFAEQLRLQREAMMAQTQSLQEAMAPDIKKTVGGTLGTENVGIKLATSADGATTSTSKRKSVRKMASGAGALRIPLNVGSSGTSGLNIG